MSKGWLLLQADLAPSNAAKRQCLELKAEDPATRERITITVRPEDGSSARFVVKPTQLIASVEIAFARLKAIDRNKYTFSYDGERVNPGKTFSDHGISDLDIIDCILNLEGC